MITRIICVGNRYIQGDDTGTRVYDYLSRKPIPENVEVLDGGLMGLDLIRLVEGTARVVFVDSLSGFNGSGEAVVLDGLEVGKDTTTGYGHSGGLEYLLRMLPAVWEGDLPEVFLVGAEGFPDEQTIADIAKTCVEIAAGQANNHPS